MPIESKTYWLVNFRLLPPTLFLRPPLLPPTRSQTTGSTWAPVTEPMRSPAASTLQLPIAGPIGEGCTTTPKIDPTDARTHNFRLGPRRAGCTTIPKRDPTDDRTHSFRSWGSMPHRLQRSIFRIRLQLPTPGPITIDIFQPQLPGKVPRLKQRLLRHRRLVLQHRRFIQLRC
eukprot:4841679-Pyramimonas_sp.AAC.1